MPSDTYKKELERQSKFVVLHSESKSEAHDRLTRLKNFETQKHITSKKADKIIENNWSSRGKFRNYF